MTALTQISQSYFVEREGASITLKCSANVAAVAGKCKAYFRML